MELTNKQADTVGYFGTLFISVRLLPTLCYNMYNRKTIKIPNTYLLLELFGTICFFVYGYHYKKYPIIACNIIIFISILCIVINNKICSKKN